MTFGVMIAAIAAGVTPLAAGAGAGSGTCIVEAGRLDDASGAPGEGVEVGGLLWRVVAGGRRVIAIDPTTLDTEIDKSLGDTDAAVLTPLAEVGGLVAVSISGPGQGGVQFLDPATGATVAAVEVAPDAATTAFRYVTTTVVHDGVAMVAATGELVVIDPNLLDSSSDPVIDRRRLPRPVASLDIADGQLYAHQLLGSRVWRIDPDQIEAVDPAAAPWPRVVDGDVLHAVVDGEIHRAVLTDGTVETVPLSVSGTVTSMTAGPATLWVGGHSPDGGFVSALDPATGTALATLVTETPVWWLWSRGDTVFVETPGSTILVETSPCGR